MLFRSVFENYCSGLKGYVIPTSDLILGGDLEIEFYLPTPTMTTKIPYLLIKDFSIKFENRNKEKVNALSKPSETIILNAVTSDTGILNEKDITQPIITGSPDYLTYSEFICRSRDEGEFYKFPDEIYYDGKTFKNISLMILYKYVQYLGKPYLTTLNLGIIGQVYNPLYSFLDHNNYEDCFLSQSELSISLATGTSELKLNVHEPYRDIKYEIS